LADDLSHAGVEVFDFSAPHRVRLPVRYTLADLPSLSDAEVTAALQRLVRAYDTVCAIGRDWIGETESRRTKRPMPPMAPGLFG
jgi:hypothetical protein